MARQGKKTGTRKFQLLLPWWVFALLAVAAPALLEWYFPQTFSGNPNSVMLMVLSHIFAWPAFTFFLLLAFVAFMGDRNRSRDTTQGDDGDQGNTEGPVSSQDERVEPVATLINRNDENSPQTWSLDILRKLDNMHFELLCARYFEIGGFSPITMRNDTDRTTSIKLFKADADMPLAIVRSNAGNAGVGVKEVQDLLAIMNQEKVTRGVFISVNRYTDEAQVFAKANSIRLLDGPGFLHKIAKLPEHRQQKLLRYVVKDADKMPMCPSCGVGMKKQIGRRGPFWACLSSPECRQIIPATGT